MTTPTTNYSWPKPVVGGDADAWGTEINTIFDDIDAQVFLYLLKTGGTVSGATTFGSTLGVTGLTTLTGGARSGSFEQDNIAAGTWYTVVSAANMPANGGVRAFFWSNFNIDGGEVGAVANSASIAKARLTTQDAGAGGWSWQIDGSGNLQVKNTNATANIFAVWTVFK